MTKIDTGTRLQRTAHVDGARCRWCRHVLVSSSGPGRPRQFCSQACRQWDWVARQRAREVQLSDDQLVLARDELNDLHDALYVLACACDDVKKDLQAISRPTLNEMKGLLQWLLDCAEPLTSTSAPLRLRP